MDEFGIGIASILLVFVPFACLASPKSLLTADVLSSLHAISSLRAGLFRGFTIHVFQEALQGLSCLRTSKFDVPEEKTQS